MALALFAGDRVHVEDCRASDVRGGAVLGGRSCYNTSAVSATFELCDQNSLEHRNTGACYNCSKATRIHFLNKFNQTAKVNHLIIIQSQVAAIWAV
jgi:hypothetical protein